MTSFRLDKSVDRLGYVTGYGIALMFSWLSSSWLGLNVAEWFANANLGSLDFAGPLVMATMMILFAKGSKADPTPWIASGVAALILFEVGAPNYLILILSVVIGVIAAIVRGRLKHA